MLRKLTAAGLALAVAMAGLPAGAVVIPKPPEKGQAKGKPKAAKPAPAPAPAVVAPPAAPVSPLLVRRRAAPPPRTGADLGGAMDEAFSEGQGWTLAVVGGETANCSGALLVKRKNGPGAFEGDATFACQASQAAAFRRATTLVEMPDGVILTFGSGADRNGPAWPPVRLTRESPDRLTGAVMAPDGNLAFTLARTGG